MNLVLIGGFVGLAIGVGLTVLWFAPAEFFAGNARALNAKQKTAERMATRAQKNQSPRATGRLDEVKKTLVRSYLRCRRRLQKN